MDDAIYTDLAPYSVLDYSLPLVDSTIDTIAFIAETERSSFVDPPVLDSHFFKIDVTKQVQWIVQHHDGKYGIAVLSPLGQGSTGKFTLWADETCNLDISSYIDRWTPPPWTKDGNTTHLLVYGDLTDSVHMERPSLIVRQTYAVSISPNPFNPSTTISFSVPGNGQAELDIFSATGKLISKKQVTGNGSYTWDASAQASGIYVCRLDVGGKAIARRMILIR